MAREREILAALLQLPGLGGRRLCQLVEAFASAEAVWQTDVAQLQKKVPLPEKVRQAWQPWRQRYDFAARREERQKHDIQLVSLWEETYPALLSQTYAPPPLLFYQGKLPQHLHLIALVGSRKATAYGKNAARFLSRTLAENGVAIVSGGARGIDTQVHTGTLEGGGETLAVVASGLDIIYPRENKTLFQQIITNGGCLLSEYDCGVAPKAIHFPARNRIIAGLSRAVVVVEAARRSGALITADFALEEGRDLFAVPGSIFSTTSQGTNNLLKKGAFPLTEAADILQEYGWQMETEKKEQLQENTLAEAALLEKLNYERGLTRTELLEKTGFSPTELHLALLRLVMSGQIEEAPPGLYVRRV